MKYPNAPEIIGRITEIGGDGEDRSLGDRIIGIQVLFDKARHREGTAQIDVREYGPKGKSVLIEVSLPDLVVALSSATLNRDTD